MKRRQIAPRAYHPYIEKSVSDVEMKAGIPGDRQHITETVKKVLAPVDAYVHEETYMEILCTIDAHSGVVITKDGEFHRKKIVVNGKTYIVKEICDASRKIQTGLKPFDMREKRTRSMMLWNLTPMGISEVRKLLEDCETIGKEVCGDCKKLFLKSPCEVMRSSSAT